MLEGIDNRLLREYAKMAKTQVFRKSVRRAKQFLRIEDGPPQDAPSKKKAPKAKRKPASTHKKTAKPSKVKK